MTPLKLWLFIALLVLETGCSVFHKETARYQTIAGNPNHDTDEARKQTAAALKLIDKGDLEAAEQKLQKALIADVSYGSAHNNLGHIYFEQGKLYLAAWEFEYATRLMPEQASPYNNLGLVYEQVGRIPEAIENYQTALQLSHGSVEITANLVRARIRHGEISPETATLLNELALRDDRSVWREWALEQLNTKHLDLLPASATSRPMDWPQAGDALPEESGGGSATPIPTTVPPADDGSPEFKPPTIPVPPVPDGGPRLNPQNADRARDMSRWRKSNKPTKGMAARS